MNEQIFILNSQKKQTSHILHLILSIITSGFWVIVWVIVAVSNNSHNNRIQKQIDSIMGYKVQGMSDAATYRHVAEDNRQQEAVKNKVLFVLAAVVLGLLYMAVS